MNKQLSIILYRFPYVHGLVLSRNSFTELQALGTWLSFVSLLFVLTTPLMNAKICSPGRQSYEFTFSIFLSKAFVGNMTEYYSGIKTN